MNPKKIINSALLPFKVQLHGINYLQALSKKDFKNDEFNFFKSYFGDYPLTIFDVGANRGTAAQKFMNIFPDAFLHAFEPIPELCKELENNLQRFKGKKIHYCGISDFDGTMKFNINAGIDTSSFLQSKKTGLNCDSQVKTNRQIEVSVSTIDSILKQENLTNINILKLDIQGSELKALYGAKNILAKGYVDLIYTEAYFIQQYFDQPLFYDIALFLKQYGYSLQDIYNPIYGNHKLAWCDAVFIKNDQKIRK